jgi:small subunit ribosomal protein S15
MALTKEDKDRTRDEITTKLNIAKNDTGSSQVQVAFLTSRIQHISEHLQTNKKDFATHRSLIKLVSQRKKLLSYLKRKNTQAYVDLTQALNLRK